MCNGKFDEVPRRKYQCYLSFTYEDLIAERLRSKEAILQAGQIPADMEPLTRQQETVIWKMSMIML